MTQLTVTNRGLAPRVLKAQDRNVILEQGQQSTVHVHPHHAAMLLREGRKEGTKLDVHITASEREAMENDLARARAAAPQPKSGQAFKTSGPHADEARMKLGMGGNTNSKMFITDPQTVNTPEPPRVPVRSHKDYVPPSQKEQEADEPKKKTRAADEEEAPRRKKKRIKSRLNKRRRARDDDDE